MRLSSDRQSIRVESVHVAEPRTQTKRAESGLILSPSLIYSRLAVLCAKCAFRIYRRWSQKGDLEAVARLSCLHNSQKEKRRRGWM